MRPGPWAGVLVAVAVGGAACSSAPAVPPGAPALAARPVAQPPALPVSGGATSLVLPATTLSEDQRILHALNRLAYGPRPGDVERVRRMGLAAYIDGQLDPRRIADPALEQALAAYPVLDRTAAALVHEYPLPTPQVRQKLAQGEMTRQDVAAMYPPERRPLVITTQMQAARITRAVLSERQLEEVMVDFWFNHFNVYAQKGAVRWMVPAYEREAIRPHALGHFRDLVRATARHPAMLFYLDNWLSTRSDFVLPRGPNAGRAVGLNENYARELMELHTLGVDGGYTQADVQEVARAFTGWGIDQRAGAFVFRAGSHDQAAKTVLGQRLPASQGKKDGEDVLDLLARHPSTARFISTKLCRRLVSDTPSEAVVARGADAFTSTGGDLAEVLRAILGTADFWNEAFGSGKAKTPHEFVVSALRAIGAEVTSARAVVEGRGGSSLTSMGMPTYEALDPTGWSDRGTDWLPNPGSHLARMNFVLSLVSQTTEGVAVDLRTLIGSADANSAAAVTAVVDQRIFGGTMPPDVASACRSVGSSGSLPAGFKVVGLALASPAFQAR